VAQAPEVVRAIDHGIGDQRLELRFQESVERVLQIQPRVCGR
jgi:hypothetical protein